MDAGVFHETFRDDVDDAAARVLSGLNVTIRIGDRGERISAMPCRAQARGIVGAGPRDSRPQA